MNPLTTNNAIYPDSFILIEEIKLKNYFIKFWRYIIVPANVYTTKVTFFLDKTEKEGRKDESF